jgi:hypothetical protein
MLEKYPPGTQQSVSAHAKKTSADRRNRYATCCHDVAMMMAASRSLRTNQALWGQLHVCACLDVECGGNETRDSGIPDRCEQSIHAGRISNLQLEKTKNERISCSVTAHALVKASHQFFVGNAEGAILVDYSHAWTCHRRHAALVVLAYIKNCKEF